MTESLADTVADQLLDAVIDGSLPPGSLLPSEGELASAHGVSRLTIREAIRILRTNNVVSIKRGRGTEVNPPDQWTSLEAIVRAFAGNKHVTAAEQLLEARRIIEIGAAQLAATRRTDDDIEALEGYLDAMKAAHEASDVDAVVEADILFHDVIVHAGGNHFLPLLFASFGPLLVETRRQTSAVPDIQEHAIAHHAEIIDALRAADANAARVAMERHMDQTLNDLRTYVTPAS
jgi:DNA-binding FadR family transcriptional regulator